MEVPEPKKKWRSLNPEINNKGVLERPWTKLKVLRAISGTLKCQFTGKC
jgi:hypothetical protein